MELGTTFLPNVGGSHLWVIISDPKIDPDHVLIVSLTTEREYKDQSCILDRGDVLQRFTVFRPSAVEL